MKEISIKDIQNIRIGQVENAGGGSDQRSHHKSGGKRGERLWLPRCERSCIRAFSVPLL